MVNFPGADIGIPVYLHDSSYSILLIQVKNRADDLDTVLLLSSVRHSNRLSERWNPLKP